ncbi:MAG: DNA lyase [Fidelibacterota bacterium]|nr:MAG: DNA lyase [Candidatus Neomarinimicrobiota bacterium]
MRLWTLHPRYLDRQGLLAVWREALLAQAVLLGNTRGYRHHPQLTRFRDQPDPLAAIGSYLEGILAESRRRGYHFDSSKINPRRSGVKIPAAAGQLRYEWQHLEQKLLQRAPQWLQEITPDDDPQPHPLFRPVPGEASAWERVRP